MALRQGARASATRTACSDLASAKVSGVCERSATPNKHGEHEGARANERAKRRDKWSKARQQHRIIRKQQSYTLLQERVPRRECPSKQAGKQASKSARKLVRSAAAAQNLRG